MNDTPIPKRKIDWQPIREAFVKRPARPTYDELADEFQVARSTITSASSDEGWPILRAQYLETALTNSGAKEIIINALSCAKAIVDAAATFGLVMFQSLGEVVNDPKFAGNAPSTRAEVLNTCSFAAANTARAMRELGVVGFAKALNQGGKEANGQWNPEMLNQINVVVQNLQTPPKAETPVAPAVELPSEKKPSQ